jgi:hypothetical protein
MRTFTNTLEFVVARYAFTTYKIAMSTIVVFGIVRVVVGLINGECTNASFGAY